MRTHLAVVLLAVMPLGRVAAVSLPKPLPPACDDSARQWLEPLLAEVQLESLPISAARSFRRQCVNMEICKLPAELAAAAFDDRARDFLRSKGIPATRFGDSLFVDASGLAKDPRNFVGALCSVKSLVTGLEWSAGISFAGASKASCSAHVNEKWLKAIDAPPASAVKPSKLTVAIIDGEVLDDHEDLPPIDRFVVADPSATNGDCKKGVCCASSGNESGHPRKPHGAWTIGTIAAIPDNGIGIDGLSKPAKVIAIETGGFGCSRAWKLANAVTCAVEQKADVILYAVGPMGGRDMYRIFKPMEDTVANSKSLLIFAAGNRGLNLDRCRVWPNVFGRNALTVTQFAEDGRPGPAVGFGDETVDLGLPLGNVCTTQNDGPKSYGTYDRTSAASAIVAGAVLQMSGHENFKNCTAPELGELLMRFAVPPIHSDDRKRVSPKGGQLNLGFLREVVRDAQGNVVDYCAK